MGKKEGIWENGDKKLTVGSFGGLKVNLIPELTSNMHSSLIMFRHTLNLPLLPLHIPVHMSQVHL
jgi:hypothetical protein